MFYCLATSATDLFIDHSRTSAWHPTYRALEHGKARNACQQGRPIWEFPAEIHSFAKAFVESQIERRRCSCSYAPSASLS